ncbi:MAG: diguanylate cyclase [Anaerolineae bacterium]|nr:diguanylate cyclase [Anaerolineae bacterium]
MDTDCSARLLDELVTPTFVLSPDGKVIIWNRALERLTGVLSATVLGTDRHWHAFYPEPRPCLADLVLQGKMTDSETLYAQAHDLNGTAIASYAENWIEVPHTGARLYVGINAGAVFDEKGNLIGVVETINDMTAQKRAELALERLASQDGLTGLANRRVLDDVLVREWRRMARDGAEMSAILIDVDCFKRYNDCLGHQAGDDCLRRIAKAIGSSTFRPADLAARYGGEEFAVILPNTNLDGAAIVVERIRAAVAGLALHHPESHVGDCVTVSIGVASTIPSLTSSPESLLTLADKRLYKAKVNGRNCAVFE